MELFKSLFLCALIFCVSVLLVSCKTTRPSSVYLQLNPEPIPVNGCEPHPDFADFNIKKIAVMDFENSVQVNPGQFIPPPKTRLHPFDKKLFLGKDDGHIVAGVFERVLLSKYKYKIVDRRDIARIIKEQQFAGTGYVEQNGIAEIGKLAGADAILTGRVIDAYVNFEVKTVGPNASRGFISAYVAYVSIEMRLVHVGSGKSFGFV